MNYDEDVFPATTAECEAPFYGTVPARDDVEPVLDLQKRYADHVLDVVADYPNVLVNLTNESRAHRDWSRFWADYVRERLPAAVIGEMPSTNRRDGGGECDYELSPLTLSTDPLFDYVDVAQGVSRHEFSDPKDQALGGADRLRTYREAMERAGTHRPLVVSKDYTRGPDGGDLILWSRFAGGAAAARFHRLGLDHAEELSTFQHEAIERLGRFIADVPFWRMQPSPELVRSLPDGSGANVLAEPDGHVVVQLVGGAEGEHLSLELPAGGWIARWIDPADGSIMEAADVALAGSEMTLEIPGRFDHRILHLIPTDG